MRLGSVNIVSPDLKTQPLSHTLNFSEWLELSKISKREDIKAVSA